VICLNFANQSVSCQRTLQHDKIVLCERLIVSAAAPPILRQVSVALAEVPVANKAASSHTMRQMKLFQAPQKSKEQNEHMLEQVKGSAPSVR